MVPEDRNLFAGLYRGLKAIVESLNLAVTSLFDVGGRENADIAKEKVDSKSVRAMIEELSNVGASNMSDSDIQAALELRRRIAKRAGEMMVRRGEWNYNDAKVDDNANDDQDSGEQIFAVESQEKQRATLPPSGATESSFSFPSSVSLCGWMFKQSGGILGIWRKRFYVLDNDQTLLWFSNKEKALAFFSEATPDIKRDQYPKRVDLLSAVKAAEVGDGSTGHVVELTSAARTWRFAPLSNDETDSFEMLWNALSSLVGIYNKGLARLSSDAELEKSVDAVRPSNVSAGSHKALLLLEQLAYSPKTMIFADKRSARALRQKILELSDDKSQIISRSERQEGALSAINGDLSQGVGTSASQKRLLAPRGPPPPMATETQGWMTFTTNESLAPPARVYGVLGSDGRVYFFKTMQDSENFFSNPSTAGADAHLLDMLDLVAALKVAKTDDQRGIEISTPGRKVTIVPEDPSFAEKFFQNIFALVRVIHRELGKLSAGAALTMTMTSENGADAPSPFGNSGLNSRMVTMMGNIEKAGTEGDLPEGLRRTAVELRRKIVAGAGLVKVEGGKLGLDGEESDDDEPETSPSPKSASQSKSVPFQYPSSVSQSGWVLKQGGGLLGMWRRRFYVLNDDNTLLWFRTSEMAERFFSLSTTDTQREQYPKHLDLLSAVKVTEVRAGYSGHVIEIASSSKRWRFAPVPGDDTGAFERLWGALSGLIGIYNTMLGTLSSDPELQNPVNEVRPSKVSEGSRRALVLLERLAYSPELMTFTEKRNATALKLKISDLAGQRDQASLIARSAVYAGEIEAVWGQRQKNTSVVAMTSVTQSNKTLAQGPPPPMATSVRGWMALGAEESLSSQPRLYGVLGTDGRIFFSANEEDCESFFSRPLSPDAPALLRDVVDLAAALSVERTGDRKGVKISTPTRQVALVPEDSSLLDGMLHSIRSLVRAFQHALGNLLGDVVLQKSSGSNVNRDMVGVQSLDAMRQIERLDNGDMLTTGERIAALSLRSRVLQGAESLNAEEGFFTDESDAEEENEEKEEEKDLHTIETNPKKNAKKPFTYPPNVILTGSFLKLGEGFFSGYNLRFFALLDDHTLKYFNSRKQREEFFSDSISDLQEQSSTEKVIDLVSVVSCRDITDRSGHHIIELVSPNRRWRIAEVMEECNEGAFSQLAAVLSDLVELSNSSVGSLYEDNELLKPVELVRVRNIGKLVDMDEETNSQKIRETDKLAKRTRCKGRNGRARAC